MILMQQIINNFDELNIQYSVGNADTLVCMQTVQSKKPFDDGVVAFLNTISKKLLSDRVAKTYPDVITLAFWLRKASIEMLRSRFMNDDSMVIRLGRGIAFHIAPSNVPVNYAYSLFTGMICGNRNIVRIPSKDFPQVNIINSAIDKALDEHEEMRPYICLVKYGHDNAVNDVFSAMADVRIIWGGDSTIKEIRKSDLKPRATEVTFADRYSLAVIDADAYLEIQDKAKVANDFYNDTYLSDQNACTSPRAVVWCGNNIEDAKQIFWTELHRNIENKYVLSDVQAVNKLTSGYMAAALYNKVKKIESGDNLITRIKVNELNAELMDIKDNSGYFFEYDCKDITELKSFCDDTRCQTISYIGKTEMIRPLVECGVSGIDRIVPMGKTMDFDFIWDGYDLFERMTRNVYVN